MSYNRLPARFHPYAREATNYIRNLGLPTGDIESGTPSPLSQPITWDWSAENARDAARTVAGALGSAGVAQVSQAAYDYFFAGTPLGSQTPVLSVESSVGRTPRSGNLRAQKRARTEHKPKSARNLFSQTPASREPISSASPDWLHLSSSKGSDFKFNFSSPSRSKTPIRAKTPSQSPYFPSSQLSTQSRLARRFQRAGTAERYYAAKALTSNWKFRGAINRRIRQKRKNPVFRQRQAVRNLRRKFRRRKFKLIFARGSQRRRRRRKLSQTRKALYRYGFS